MTEIVHGAPTGCRRRSPFINQRGRIDVVVAGGERTRLRRSTISYASLEWDILSVDAAAAEGALVG